MEEVKLAVVEESKVRDWTISHKTKNNWKINKEGFANNAGEDGWEGKNGNITNTFRENIISVKGAGKALAKLRGEDEIQRVKIIEVCEDGSWKVNNE